jgi:hypothetical protein
MVIIRTDETTDQNMPSLQVDLVNSGECTITNTMGGTAGLMVDVLCNVIKRTKAKSIRGQIIPHLCVSKNPPDEIHTGKGIYTFKEGKLTSVLFPGYNTVYNHNKKSKVVTLSGGKPREKSHVYGVLHLNEDNLAKKYRIYDNGTCTYTYVMNEEYGLPVLVSEFNLKTKVTTVTEFEITDTDTLFMYNKKSEHNKEEVLDGYILLRIEKDITRTLTEVLHKPGVYISEDNTKDRWFELCRDEIRKSLKSDDNVL